MKKYIYLSLISVMALLSDHTIDAQHFNSTENLIVDTTDTRSFYQRKSDWQSIVDQTMGNNLSVADKQSVFNKYCNIVEDVYPLFDRLETDWESLRGQYYAQITEDVSDGAFAGLISTFASEFEELHMRFWDIYLTQGTPVKQGTPIYFYKTFDVSHFGATLEMQPDSTLLVVKTVTDHPLGLEAGDKVLGYEGMMWKELTFELFKAGLPAGGYLGSSKYSIENMLMTNAGMNWHLFNSIDVLKFGETEPSSLSLFPLAEIVPDGPVFTGEIYNNPQLPIAGIPQPTEDPFFNEGAITYGIIDAENLNFNTRVMGKVGYIYVNDHGYNEIEEEFNEAVQFVMDQETDGLIIDLRWNSGGYINPRQGLEKLFNESIDVLASKVRCDESDLTSICDSRGENTFVPFWFNWEADPSTFYDKPIAILIGPDTQSMGDFLAYQLSFHPNAETFGRESNAAFSGNTNTSLSIGERWAVNIANFFLVHPEEPTTPLVGRSVEVDHEVWLTPEDV